jgi:hypothetical protein
MRITANIHAEPSYQKDTNDKIQGDEKDVRQQAMEKIKEALEPENNMSEEDKKAYEDKLNKKIKNGEELTSSELSYIRRTNPTLYIHVKRVQMQRELLEKKLENCKSKKEVDEAYSQAITGISKEDPDREALTNAYNNVTTEFKKTDKYRFLPQEIKKEEKKEKEHEKELEDVLDSAAFVDEVKKTFDIKI